MPTKSESIANGVESSYLALSGVASELNAISDELGKPVAEIDAALKKLNLGITAWVKFNGWEDTVSATYYAEEIGYSKVDGKWGIAVRTISGDMNNPDEERREEWIFNEAPRKMRLAAIGGIPGLLNRLSEEAVETTNKIKDRLVEVREVADAVKKAAWAPPPDLDARPVGRRQAIEVKK
jgi:hypothetical protein